MTLSPEIALVSGAAVGALLGAVVGWLAAGRKTAANEARIAALRDDVAERERALETSAAELARTREAADRARDHASRLETTLEHERRAAREKLELLEAAEKRLADTFKLLSNEALEASRRSFLDVAKTSIEELHKRAVGDLDERRKAVDELVAPIGKALERVDGQLTESEKERVRADAALREQLEHLREANRSLRDETSQLKRALRAPDVRGRWGEIQLRRVVELAGMTEHCDFDEQSTSEGDGTRLRPDLVVHLPGGKHVVVDAKAPLTAYLDAMGTEDPDVRRTKLADHARQVREHVRALASKSYWRSLEGTPEFVVLFLPGETFFSEAVRSDPSLIDFAIDQSVIPASPTTLVALLRAVHYGWQQERVAKSAEEIKALGSDLYDRLRTMAGYLENVGKHLDRAVKAHNESIASLEARVLVPARKLREMGAGSSNELPTLSSVERAARRPLPASDSPSPSTDQNACPTDK